MPKRILGIAATILCLGVAGWSAEDPLATANNSALSIIKETQAARASQQNQAKPANSGVCKSVIESLGASAEDFENAYICSKSVGPLISSHWFYRESFDGDVIGGTLCIAANKAKNAVIVGGDVIYPCTTTHLCAGPDGSLEDGRTNNESVTTSVEKRIILIGSSSAVEPGIHGAGAAPYPVVRPDSNGTKRWTIDEDGMRLDATYTHKVCKESVGLDWFSNPTYAGECVRSGMETKHTELTVKKDFMVPGLFKMSFSGIGPEFTMNGFYCLKTQ
jgi:hypothetical protein